MAEPPARAPNGRFTSANASYFGKRGAAERERRFLQRHASLKERRRKERNELSWAVALVHMVYGPPWRPRRVPRYELEMAPRLVEVVEVLGKALDYEQNAQRMRAIETLLYLVSRQE